MAETLPPNTSAQKAELIALIQALEQPKGRESPFLLTADMLSALPIFKVQYTKKGDFGQLRERRSKISPRFAGS